MRSGGRAAPSTRHQPRVQAVVGHEVLQLVGGASSLKVYRKLILCQVASSKNKADGTPAVLAGDS
jgi:hypothetical protein